MAGLANRPGRRHLDANREGYDVLKLYSTQSSGNAFKVRLLLARLRVPFHLVEVDIFAGENRTPQFLALNPEGRVPLLELEDGAILAESNAILFYLADGTDLLPSDRRQRAEVLRWMFFEQNNHEPGIAQARFWLRQVRGGRDLRTHDVDRWMEEGYGALRVMERHLESRCFFVGDALTVADLALYPHTWLAPEGDFDLASFPAIGAWLARVAGETGGLDLDWRPPFVSYLVAGPALHAG